MRVAVEGAELLGPGPHVALCRHASIADSLVSAWVFGTVADRRPRYVLKRELASDPCLDVVGRRLPNYFVDRAATDTTVELDGIARMAEGMGPGDIAVIFAEGTRASATKRRRILDRMERRDPRRAAKMSALVHLLPPKVSGPARLVESVPDADVVCVWHVGFDGLDTFGGMIRAVGDGRVDVRFVIDVRPRAEVPAGEAFADWLDDRWLEMDAYVGAATTGVGDDR
jgi:1-acyl-sn-glycerol-3-phosphate acyltransferase